MSSKQILIHIGYPKTASTWLQNAIFNNQNVGFLDPWGLPSIEEAKQFACTNSVRFAAESARRVFEPGLQEASRRNLVPVFSNEELSGKPNQSKYWGKEVCDQIHAIFPEARILICIREQKSMLMSLYQQQIKNGENTTLRYYFELSTEKQQSGYSQFLQLDHFL